VRILFIAFRDPKNPSAVGGDIYLWELAKGLGRRTNDVTFLCSRFENSVEKEEVDGDEVIRVQGGLRLTFNIFAEYIRRFKGRVDIIIEEAFGGQRFPFFAGVYAKGPLISVWHQRHNKIFREQYPLPLATILSSFEMLLAKIYSGRMIVTPSKGAKEKVQQLGFRSGNIEIVYDGVDRIFHDLTPIKERQAIIVCLGKLRRYKRPDHAILALSALTKMSNSSARLIIAGKVSEIDRTYVDSLRRLAEKLDLSNSVDFRINISETEKLDLLAKALVLVQPSPVEGFSIVVAEANRCGTPVVVSDGIPADVVVNGYNGFVYHYGDIPAFASAINCLINDSIQWRKMSENAYKWSMQFTWEASVARLQSILDNICSKRFETSGTCSVPEMRSKSFREGEVA
jgi:glycosyltransferase involved in cell wall biosynthesis